MRTGFVLALLLLATSALVFLFLHDGTGGRGGADRHGLEDREAAGPAGALLVGRGANPASIPLDSLLGDLLDPQGQPDPRVIEILRERSAAEPDLAAELVRRIRDLLGSRRRYDYRALNRLASALVACGERGAEALAVFLREPEDVYFDFAAYQTRTFADHAAPLVAELVAQLSSIREFSQHRASVLLSALESMAPMAAAAAPSLAALLRPPLEDPLVSSAASALAAVTGPTEETLALLRGVIEDPDTEARSGAIAALGQLGAGAAALVPLLIDALQDSEAAVRATAARALGLIGVSEPDVLRELAFMLIDDHQKHNAAWALTQLGADGASVLLDTARRANDVQARLRALQALRSMGGDMTEAVEMLLGILDERVERGWKVQAIYLLGGIDPLPDPSAVLKALVRAASDPVLQSAANQSLLRLADEAGRPFVLAQATDAADPDQRFAATTALVNLRQPLPEAGRALVGLVGADLSRTDARRVLGMFRFVKPPVAVDDGLPALRPLLADEDRQVRVLALQAIRALRGDSVQRIEAYLEVLDDARLRAAATQGLAEAPQHASMAVPPLLRRAERDVGEFGFVGGDVVQTLRILGPHWDGTRSALRAAAEGLQGKPKATLEQLLENR